MTSVCGQIKGLRPDGTPVGGTGAPEIAAQQDIYVCHGGREEQDVPSFTFHAFRYVEVTGFPARPRPGAITGLRLHADVETAGRFRCSDPIFNRIQDMTRRTFLSNLFSVQSDCPHRERFGYGGDLAATCEAFLMNFNMASFYAKAVRDWHDAALPDGMLTDTAPFVGIQYCGVAWAMVHPLLQEQLYRYYGDQRLIEEQYPTSRRWLDLVVSRFPSHIVTEGLSDHEGLEPAPAGPMVTPFYAESAGIVSRLAGILGLEEDEKRYSELSDAVRRAYVDSFLEPGTGTVLPDTQAGQALALGLDLLPPQEREAALDVLIRKIREEHKVHLTTGIFGTPYLLEVLSDRGHADLVAAVIRQKTFPGWGHMLEKGATTLWERWEFSDTVYSQNHPMFGSVSAWFFRWLAGIQVCSDSIGFDRIRIRPQPVEGVNWVEAEYRSPRGPVRVAWWKAGREFVLKVGIPPNLRAEIEMPASATGETREDIELGKPFPGTLRWKTVKGHPTAEIGSGEYTFRSRIR
jgi:alpha-L-rhamnosidase